MLFSIIVSTKENKTVRRLIDSIYTLDEDFELIVVDASKKKKRVHCDKYIHAPKTNHSQARNLGSKVAQGEILVFTDDDCIVDKKWLAAYKSCFGGNQISMCAGRVFNKTDNRLFNKCFKYDLGEREKRHQFSILTTPWKVGHGNNIAIRKNLFQEVGGFDEMFGPGTEIRTAEDSELIYHVLKRGYLICYCPRAVVYHHINPRDTAKDAYWYGFGGHFLFKKYKTGLFLVFTLTLFNIIRKAIFSKRRERKVWISFLQGWLGIRQ